jgi:hypothetical protein
VLDFSLVDDVGLIERFANCRIEEFLFERRVQFEIGAGLLDELLASLLLCVCIEFLEVAKCFLGALVIFLEQIDDFLLRFRATAAAA